jgi:hypothetical protein
MSRMIAKRESASLANRLIADTCEKQHIIAAQLTLRADRETSTKSTIVAQLQVDLGVVDSHFHVPIPVMTTRILQHSLKRLNSGRYCRCDVPISMMQDGTVAVSLIGNPAPKKTHTVQPQALS